LKRDHPLLREFPSNRQIDGGRAVSVQAPQAAVPPSNGVVVAEPTFHRFSVEQYHRMIAAGILTENDRVQLIDGYVVAMTPIGPPHSFVARKLTKLLSVLIPDTWEIRIQQPITLSTSEPEPDVVVARGTIEDFKTRHPGPSEVALAVEVTDSSLAFDRGSKAGIYAHDGIAQCWIVCLAERTVEVDRSPVLQMGKSPARYETSEIVNVAGTLNVAFDEESVGAIRVADILP
jgi:Uma2 family endonuclease